MPVLLSRDDLQSIERFNRSGDKMDIFTHLIDDYVKNYNVIRLFNIYISEGTRPIFLEGNFQKK